jgi:hypothetical protein
MSGMYRRDKMETAFWKGLMISFPISLFLWYLILKLAGVL